MKTVHTISFCLTRMAYLLTACAQLVDLLLFIYDVIASAEVKKEESEVFLSRKLMIIMHLLADFQPIFQLEFLKPLDHDHGTIITAYRIIESFSNQIHDQYQPKESENFLNNISDDNNGNISLQMKLTHSFPMHSFSIPRKKGALGTNGLKEDHFLTLN